MKLDEITAETKFYSFDWIQRKDSYASDFLLCTYTVYEKIEQDRVFLRNSITDKITIVWQEKLDLEFSETPLEAAKKGIADIKLLIKHHQADIEQLVVQVEKLIGSL
jgi:hypothetical protein